MDEFDVVQVKKALNRLGYYLPHKETGITDFADTAIFTALREFQSDHGMPATGEARPDDETIATINAELKDAPDGLYLWRCVEDGKARPEHARYNGTIRRWHDAPDPGEDFNCRCWAEHINPSRKDILADAINPTIGPFDLLSGAAIVRSVGGRVVTGIAAQRLRKQIIREAANRDVEWIRNAPKAQLQSKFKHAIDFGVNGNPNNRTLNEFRKALEQHIKSPDTQIIKGTYRGKSVTPYYNKHSKINVIRTKEGRFSSTWKLSDDQIQFMNNGGHIGGGN